MSLSAGPRSGLARSLTIVGACLALFVGASAASAAVITGSNPAPGAQVDTLGEVELTFSAPVDVAPDGVRIVAPDGSTYPVSNLEATDDTVRVTVGDVGTGMRALTVSGVERATGDPVTGSVVYAVGAPPPRLDANRAVSAASGSELGVALTAVALIAATLAILALLIRNRRSNPDGSRQPIVPIPAIVVAAGTVAVLGAAIGIAMGMRGRAAIAGGGALDQLASSTFALWSLVALIVAVAMIALAGRVRRGTAGLTVGIALVICGLVSTVGVATADQPAPPADPVAVRALLDNGGQVSLSLDPAAVGANSATVQMGGLGDDLGSPVLLLRPLDGRIGTMRIPLEPAAGGDFTARDVLIPFPGRWRGQVEGVPGIAEDDPALFDFDIQATPEQ